MKKCLRTPMFSSALALALAAGAWAQSPSSSPSQGPSSGPPSGSSGAGGPSSGAPGGMNSPDAGSSAPKKVDDKKFLKEAAIGGMMEVEAGKLAAQKGGSDDVKQFGQKMVDDHSKANDQLKELAQKQSVDVPASLDPKHQAQLDKLAKLSGADFDKAYMKNMVKDHQKDVSQFQDEAQYGTDPNVKQFATSTLPTLQEHLEKAKSMNKKGKDSK